MADSIVLRILRGNRATGALGPQPTPRTGTSAVDRILEAQGLEPRGPADRPAVPPPTSGSGWTPPPTTMRPIGPGPGGSATLDILGGGRDLPNSLDAAGRFVTAALSPLQAPQDLMFATAAGVLNPNRTVGDYYAEMEWANYVPWNRAPVRPVSGQELVRLAGVQNESVQRWAGLGLDFLADPLLGGMALRAAAKLPGLARNAAAMNRLAGALDTVAESSMLLGALPTARVVNTVRAIPAFAPIEKAVNDRFVTRVLGPMLEFLDRTTVRAGFGRNAPPLTSAAGTQFSISGLFDASRGRLEGAQESLGRIGAAAQEMGEDVAVVLMQAMAAAGDPRWKSWMERWRQSQAIVYDIPMPVINQFRSGATTDAIWRHAYTAAEDVGYVVGRQMGGTSVRSANITPSPSDIMRAATRDIDTAEGIIGRARLNAVEAQEMRQRVSAYQRARTSVGDAAVKFELPQGANPAQIAQVRDQAENAFDLVVERLQQATVLNGYFGSGYGMLHETFLGSMAGRLSGFMGQEPRVAAAVQAAGGEAVVARTAWRRLLQGGARGRADKMLDEPVPFPGANLIPDAERPTYRQVFGDYAELPALNLGTWLNSLTRGHMRRTFGAFHDETSWRESLKALQDGRITPVRTIDNKQVFQTMQQRTPALAPLAKVADEYVQSVMPRYNPARATGGFVRQEDLGRHLVERGFTPTQIEDFFTEMVKIVDPRTDALVQRLAAYGAREIGDQFWFGQGREVLRGAQSILRSRRSDLDRDTLSTLMEMMDPVLSVVESSVATNRAFRRQESIASIFELAKKRGLVMDSTLAQPLPGGGVNYVPNPALANIPRWHRWVAMGSDTTDDVFPLFANKTVHPIVARELRNLTTAGRSEAGFVNGLANLRAIITGGYLANPATTAANVAGGFWTAMQYGIDPIKLFNNMVEVFRDWKKMGRELPELRDMRDVLGGGASQTEFIRTMGDMRASALGVREVVDGVAASLSEGARRYQEFLRRPFGVGALGLQAFEASEALFRLGTYRMVMKATGDAAEARRMARFVVFDYANQPGLVQFARDTGVFLFPAFPYFAMGRTLNAAVNRPGLLAAGERAPEFITNVQLPNEDDRLAFVMGLEDWQRSDKFVPWRVQPNGDVSAIPFNQLFPTNTLTGASFVDSLRSLGLWGPTIDLVLAVAADGDRGDAGEGPFTGAFGRRTMPELVSFGTDPAGASAGVASFIWNSFAPGILRKLVRAPENTDQEWTGLIPELASLATPIPEEWRESGRTVQELYQRRADQDIFDAVVSTFVRSSRTIATEGPLANAMTIARRAAAARDRALAEQDRVITYLNAKPQLNADEQARLDVAMRRRQDILTRFEERWGAIIRETVRMRDVERRFDPPGR